MKWITLFLPFFLFAKTPEISTKESIKNFEKKWESIHSIKCKFTQKLNRKNSAFTEPERKGILLVEKPAKMRWQDVTENFTQLIDGKKYYQIQFNKRRQNRTVDIISDLNKLSTNGFLSFLSGRKKLKELYQIKWLEERKATVKFKLTPLTKSNDSLIAEVSKESYLLQSIILDSTEDRVVIEFQDMEINTKIDPKQFQYEPQPNDVVHKG